MSSVPGAQARQRVPGVGLDRFLAEVELFRGGGRRTAVGEQLQDLALAPGQLAAAPARRHRGVEEALVGESGPGRPQQVLGGGGAGEVGGGAGMHGPRRDVALGTVAVGHDADARRGPAQQPDRLVAAQRPLRIGRGPAQVDDRDVDAADVADQLDRLVAAFAFLHLEAVREGLADADAHQWVPVDHEALWSSRAQEPILTGWSAPCGRKTGVISITSKSRYAVVAMAELARSGDRPVPIKELAERRGIPEQFLEQLFSTLRRGGLLTSHRGMKGGYTLSRSAEEITVLEVVQTLDGKVGQEADEAGGIWAEGVTALRKVFGQTTIAAVARRELEEADSGMYFI